MHNVWDLPDGNEPLFIDRFSNENDFSAALHEGGIKGVAQDSGEQEGDNYYDNSNTKIPIQLSCNIP